MAKNVLVVEDDKFLRKAYQSKLTLSGFNVEVAVNGEEGLQKIREMKPDIVLLDLMMAKKSGFDVLATIKEEADPAILKIPILVLSSLAQESDQRKAKDLGATEFMVKSNTPINAIVEKIKFYLNKKK